ncbi:MAG: TIGR03663 family protein [Acidobacteriia bacterium]|nr:TIGR03663 family protein [Terriglobia bacterium]
MSKAAFLRFFLAALFVGLAFRLWRLDSRPMHHDEANQAVKFGTLLETGEYRYDRNDHHGPTLYYLTLPAAWVRGQKTLSALDEWTLRAVPAAFGVGLLLLFGLLTRKLGREAVVLSAFFAALSPALTYYSRFYIQESLFVFFSLGFLIALGRYAFHPAAGSALAAGACAGLAYATKETSVVMFAAAGAAFVVAMISTIGIPRLSNPYADPRRIRIVHILAGLGVAVSIAFVFYSSFFRTPGSTVESVRAFKDYFARGTEPGLHVHPWFYYFQMLVYSSSGGLVWTEGLILVLALVGTVIAFGRTRTAGDPDQIEPAQISYAEECFWPRYFFLYSLFTAAAFSIFSYKTPWNLLAFYAGLILLAGSGAAALLKSLRSPLARSLLLILLLAGSCHLGLENWRANYSYPADPRNPYAYVQTSSDFLRLVKRVHDLTAVHGDGKDMLVKVVAGPYEQWPLPWYLRDLRHVGYWTSPADAGGFDHVPVVIASQENVQKLESILGDHAQTETYGLRPDILLTLYIDRPLWERFLNRK